MALQPLSRRDSRRVVQAILQTAQRPTALGDAILAQADGNPFFLEELTRAVIEHADPEAALDVPDTIQGVLSARIDRLPEEAKRLLQTAAVLGREFAPALL